MRYKHVVGICFFSLLLVAACAPKEGPLRGIFKPERPGPALFEKAEEKYRQSEYSEARELYRQYLAQYPDTDRAGDARLRLGMIRMHRKDFAGARQMFADLIQNRPYTLAGRQARVAIVESWVAQGRFQEALESRKQIPEWLLDRQQLSRADLLAGDAMMALGQFDAAYEFFLSGFQRAQKDQRPDAASRLLAAAFTMAPEQIQAELDRLEGKPPSGYLMYCQGLLLASESRIGDALTLFQRFLDQYPQHPKVDEVRREMERLTSEAFFEGHTLGCVLPLSGKYEAFGKRALRGIELAVHRAAIRMEVSPSFNLLVRDSASDPETAKKAVEQLAEKQVAGIIGPMIGDGQALSAAQQLGVPIIALTQKPDVTKTGAYVFRNFLTPQMQVSALVEHSMEKLGCRRFAVLFPDEPYGETFLHLFWDELMARGGWIVGAEPYNPDHTDFAEPIRKLVGLYYDLPEDLQPEKPSREQLDSLSRALMLSDGLFLEKQLPEPDIPAPDQSGRTIPRAGALPENPGADEDEPIVDFDAIFIPDSPEKAGLIIPQLRYYDINDVYLLGTNLWHSPRLLEIAGSQVRRAVIAEGFFAQSRQPLVADFVSAFSEVYGHTPGYIEAVSYDSAMMLCEQMARKEVANRPALYRALLDMREFEGVTGQTRFSASGEAQKTIYLLDVSGRRFVEIVP